MKKIILLFTVFMITQALFAQQKEALVVGNGNYTGLSKLANPVNDANDMAAALQGLGFNVDKVLDACRDNPFAWARSGSRGLSVIANQQSDSIVVYATSAGSTAADVAQASERKQIPAVYSQFFGNAYLGSAPVATAPVQPTPAPEIQPAAQPAARLEAPTQYKIGDRDPAEGIVFYDNGFYNDSWRYLEAAPVDLQNAGWGLWGVSVNGLKTYIGSGKQNTELIIAALSQSRESGKAAQLCKAYTQGGYSDWFLPSQDELDLMHKNLKQNNLGGFKSGFYWSSSQVGTNNAWLQSFNYGIQGSYTKNDTGSVRAVRAF